MKVPSPVQAMYSGDVPLSPLNGGRLIKSETLKSGDLVLLTGSGPAIPAAIRTAGGATICQAGVFVGGSSMVIPGDQGPETIALEDAMSRYSHLIVLRHPQLSPEKRGVMIDNLQERTQQPGTAVERFVHLRRLQLPLDAEICAAAAPQFQEKCRRFIGRIDLGTEHHDAFFVAKWLLETLSAAGLDIITRPVDWTTEHEDIVNRQFNGQLYYSGHLKFN